MTSPAASAARAAAARTGPLLADAAMAGLPGGQADLWCTYAAVRTLSWLGLTGEIPDQPGTAAFLRSRLNADGGYAWMKGMPSDAWATYYCTQALRDLGVSPGRLDRTSDWLRGTFSGAAYAMMPGQAPDVWATHFSARTAVELLGEDVPARAALLRWLAGLQTADGGLAWTPEHAARADAARRTKHGGPAGADLRACHYGITAWRILAGHVPADPPWDVPRLVAWMRAQQTASGGFRFAPDATLPCLWATFRGCAALAALGAAPLRRDDCVAWIHRLRDPAGGFVRWDGYPVQDVWASFCAVGALQAMGAPVDHVRAGVAAVISGFAVDGGGFTYREPPLAGDALTTSAAVLRGGDGHDQAGLRAWLTACQLPNEGGIMYMPARGAEVRCTLWALAAGALAAPAGRRRAASWLAALQNPDGGFGYWEGRGSDLVSTAAAVEIAELLAGTDDQGPAIRLAGARRFTGSCAARYPDGAPGYAALPGAEPALRPGLQAARVLAAGQAAVPAGTRGLRALLERHRVPGGGYADRGARLPDLLTTYEAVATADRHGVPVDAAPLRAFLDRLAAPDGYRWTPLTPGGGGPLTDCLGDLLARRLARGGVTLPILVL
jgi:hypothetical protein